MSDHPLTCYVIYSYIFIGYHHNSFTLHFCINHSFFIVCVAIFQVSLKGSFLETIGSHMDLIKKHNPHLKFKIPDTQTLLKLRRKVKSVQLNNFHARYGWILELLDTTVDHDALKALAKFYDAPLRCFTFQDFQLVPTIEELERLLNWPLKDDVPFTRLGECLDAKDVAAALHLPIREIGPKLVEKGISRRFLEQRAEELAVSEENWMSFSAVLALLIYGVVLFPSNDDDYISQPAIGVFLSDNPVPALLADILLNIHIRYEKKKGVVMCCSILLYSWLKSHIPQRGPWAKILENLSWSQKLDSLTATGVFWYSPDWYTWEVITHCGAFPNVPLIGYQGCINYNPRLVLKQLGCPMETVSKGEFLKEFILLDFEREDVGLLKQIQKAWTQVHRKGVELRKRGNGDGEPYESWILRRVMEVKLPFAVEVPFEVPELEVTHVPVEEFNRLKLTITEMQAEEGRQQAALTRVTRERDDLAQSLRERDDELLKSQELVEKEKKAKFRVKDNLDAANFELREFNRKLARAEQQRGKAYADEERAIKAKSELKTTLTTKIQELKAALKDIESSLARETRLKEEARLARNMDSEELAQKIQELDTARDLVARWEASSVEWELTFEGWKEEARRQNELWVNRGETIFTLEEQNKSLYDNYSGLV